MEGNKNFLELAGISSFQDSVVELLKNLAYGTISRVINNSAPVLAIDLFLRRSSSATTTYEVVCRISLSRNYFYMKHPTSHLHFLGIHKSESIATLLCHAMP